MGSSAVFSTSRRRLLGAAAAAPLLAGTGLLSGCASQPAVPLPLVQPLGQSTFAAYAADTRAWIESRRRWATADHALELEANAPSESLPPEGMPVLGGVLCIHGLGDSPWSFVDQAKNLSAAGWLVRTVLLPGCGTMPEDMAAPTADDWRRVVLEQSAILRRDLDALGNTTDGHRRPMWLAGFSTGCNLATEAALDGKVKADGLLLFSPAFVVRTNLAFLAPLAKPFITWLREPQESMMGGQTAFRYTIVPVPALAAFVDTMRGVDRALKEKTFDKPVVAMLAERDSILDTQELIEWLPKRFTSPQTRFFWYGSTAGLGKSLGDTRIIVRTDQIPEDRITSFSHMSMTYSPENPEYGRRGRSRICTTSNSRRSGYSYEACRKGPVDYGAWGDERRGLIRARLTFNSYFDEQQEVIQAVMRTTL